MTKVEILRLLDALQMGPVVPLRTVAEIFPVSLKRLYMLTFRQELERVAPGTISRESLARWLMTAAGLQILGRYYCRQMPSTR